MTRFCVGLLTMLICSDSIATTVGGIIETDTSWLDTSEPYVISGAVQIAPGTTLTIGQGVTVTAGDIAVFGTLDIHGTASNPVLLDDVDVLPGSNSATIDQPFQIDIDHP